MEIDYTKLDVEKLAGIMQGTDPIAVLTDIGMTVQQASAASQGDFSSIGNDIQKPLELDFDVIMSNYGKYFNRQLIEYFFIKSKNSEAFTEEEMETYKIPYKAWFDFVFKIGELNIYLLDESLPDSKCLSIQVGSDHFCMMIVNGVYMILKLDI